METNVLYYGDNLDILRHDPPYIPPESVDLIYLDPPFNSNATYNVIFKDESGQRSDAQIVAFDDTWHWGPKAEEHYLYLTNSSYHKGRVPSTLSDLIGAFHSGIRPSPMLAYLVEMAVRLVELHRTLKPSGSLYLHCDPTASHYLKLVLDAVFGPQNFRNEIIWRRTGSNNNAKRFGPIHQTIFYYAKSESTEFNQFWLPYTKAYVESAFSLEDERGRYQSVALTGPGTREGESGKPWRGYNPTSVGRHWQPASYLYRKYVALTGEDLANYPLLERLDKLDEVGLIHRPTPKHAPRYRFYLEDAPGVPAQDIWAHQPGTRGVVYGSKEEIDEDVSWLNVRDAERLRWPTQKPVGLLERIIRASSKPGDVVFDPFCGCGTALVAAQKLGRLWIGIDITILSIAVMQGRLRDSFGIIAPIEGSPTEVEGARKLAQQKPNGREQFELWALTLVGATPVGGVQKKGADRGVDGVITFTGVGGKVETCIVSVKSGHVTRAQVAELKGDMASQGAFLGLFVTLEEPTAPMRREATEAGFYHSDLSGMDYPVVQICTIRQLLEEGKKPMLPLLILPAYQQAEKIDEVSPGQQELFGGVS